MVKDSSNQGYVLSSLNDTFVSLILKKDNSISYNDYRPLFLCNLIYTIIGKVIASILKLELVEGMSKEYFGFLNNRKNFAIGVVQESLHSVKVKKLQALLLKMYLVKINKKLNWTFLRLVILQIGLSIKATYWIMECVSSMTFVVLVIHWVQHSQ